MLDDVSAAIAANRFGLGARPGELAAVGADARGWLTPSSGAARRCSRPPTSPPRR